MDAVREATASTLDRLDLLEIERLGPATHAESYRVADVRVDWAGPRVSH